MSPVIARLLIAALLLFGAGPGARPDAAPRLKERAQLTLRAAPDAVALPAADAPPDITFTARVLDPNGEAAGVRIGYRVFIRSAAEALFERLEHERAAIPPRDMAASGGGATDQGQVTFYQDVLRAADLPPEAVIVDVVAEAHAYDAAGELLEGVATTLRVPFFDTARQPVLRLISPAPGDALVEGWQRFIVTLERNRTNTAYYQLAFAAAPPTCLSGSCPATAWASTPAGGAATRCWSRCPTASTGGACARSTTTGGWWPSARRGRCRS
ncbi:MAG: hypothetical protein M5R40_23125 [Anaerolineae bacterium]|nr:hypothetical protein [Anaerolineae bacterium]